MIALAAVVAASAGSLCLPTGAARRAIPTDSYTSVPLRSGRTKGHTWVECEVCGRPVKLVVDTGAGQTLIVPTLAARLGLRLGPPVRAVLPNGSKAESRAANVGLRVGDITREPFPVAVMDLSAILDALRQAEGVEFAGLLGADFLGTQDAIIDLRNRQLHLRDTPAEDRATLQGRRRAAGMVYHGRVLDDERMKQARFEVIRNRFTFRSLDSECCGTLDLDTGEFPRRMNLS